VCLAVPARHVSVSDDDPLFRTGMADFGGARREVALACVPDARPGDYLLVHAGMAITRLDQAAADRLLAALAEAQGTP